MNSNKRIIFFDGVCNLCNRSVNIIISLDTKNKFFFAPLQGETAKKYKLSFDQLDIQDQSIYYVGLSGKVFNRSNAIIEILNELFIFGWFFKLLLLIPKTIRDFFYKKIANNRYRVFGKKSTCRLPSKEETERFLD